MKFSIIEGEMAAAYGAAEFLAPNDLEELEECPACAKQVGQERISLAEGTEQKGISLSLCRSCDHIYLSRRPTSEWYRTYYGSQWDTGRTEDRVSLPASIRALLSRSRLVWRTAETTRVARKGADFHRDMHDWRMLSMLAGVAHARGADELPRSGKLLEIGAGYGSALLRFQRAGFEVFGTEASSYRAAVCRRRGLQVEETGVSDFEPIARYGPFDFAYSAHVFEHLLDLRSLMSQLAPLVADNGILYIEVPHSPVAENLLDRTHSPLHCHLFSANSLRALLGDFGFQVVRVLADINLHVVAMKSKEPVEFPAPDIGNDPEGLKRGLQAIREDHGKVSYSWDHYYVHVRRCDDGSVVYERPKEYGIEELRKPGTTRLVNSFVLKALEDDGPSFPVRFMHETPAPPIWLKRQ